MNGLLATRRVGQGTLRQIETPASSARSPGGRAADAAPGGLTGRRRANTVEKFVDFVPATGVPARGREKEASEMEKSMFRRVVAYSVLLAAVCYVAVTVAGAVRAQPVQAAAGNVIAFAGSDTTSDKVFVVDTSQNVILVYGSAGRTGFELMAGRRFDTDAEVAATATNGIPFRANGYTTIAIKSLLK